MHKTNIVCIFFNLEAYHRMLIVFDFCKSYYIAGDKQLLDFLEQNVLITFFMIFVITYKAWLWFSVSDGIGFTSMLYIFHPSSWFKIIHYKTFQFITFSIISKVWNIYHISCMCSDFLHRQYTIAQTTFASFMCISLSLLYFVLEVVIL